MTRFKRFLLGLSAAVFCLGLAAVADAATPYTMRVPLRGMSYVAPPSDPYFGDVSSLIHFDGNIVDQTGAVITKTAGVTVNSTTTAVGTGSGNFTSTDTLQTNTGALNFGTGDFTVEMWFKYAGGNNGYITLFTNNGAQGYNLSVMFGDSGYGHSLFMIVGNNPGNLYLSGVTKSTIGTGWHHYALTRQAGTFYMFYDGGLVLTKTGVGSSFTSNLFQIGNGIIGQVDEVRVTKGYARYTSNFTPSTTPYPNQ